jgi:hypothetical protein
MSERLAFKSAGAVRKVQPPRLSESEPASDIKAELTAALIMMTDMYESKFGETNAVLMARAVIARARAN